ncbi:MAG: PilZ domain-containing protein [Gemmatimonadaceae bacterium]
MNYPFDRSEYRIPYPPSARPRITIAGEVREVVDCSEQGLRYVAEAGRVPETGAKVSGMVRLVSGGAPINVTGVVVRIQEGEVALQLDSPGISVQRVFQEQRYLGRHFPARQ